MKLSDAFVMSNKSKIDKKYHVWLKDSGYPAAGNSPDSKEDAFVACLANVRRLCSSWKPVVIIHDGHCLFIYRSGLNWSYRVDDSECEHSGWGLAENAEKYARRHLAQIIYSPHDDGKASFDAIDLDDLDGRSDHASWCRFQRDYSRIATQNPGMPSNEVRQLACGLS